MAEALLAKERLNDLVVHHMRTDFPRLNVNQTVFEALAAVRSRPPEGRIIYFYVVNDDNQLEGVVPTRRLLMSPLDKRLGEIMVTGVITIPQTATVLTACEYFTQFRLLAFPVVDDNRKMLGTVDVDLYTQELRDIEFSQQSDELFQLIGVHLEDARQTTPLAAFRNRFPWLLTNITGGVLAAFLSGMFKTELERAVALALFIPVVLALAESVAIQSVSLALQLLRGQKPTLAMILVKIRSEAIIGLLLGCVSALTVASVALVWLQQSRVVLCLLGGITGGVTCAAAIGVAMPNILHYLQREPEVAAGPIALASTDMITLLIYFTLARALLG